MQIGNLNQRSSIKLLCYGLLLLFVSPFVLAGPQPNPAYKHVFFAAVIAYLGVSFFSILWGQAAVTLMTFVAVTLMTVAFSHLINLILLEYFGPFGSSRRLPVDAGLALACILIFALCLSLTDWKSSGYGWTVPILTCEAYTSGLVAMSALGNLIFGVFPWQWASGPGYLALSLSPAVIIFTILRLRKRAAGPAPKLSMDNLRRESEASEFHSAIVPPKRP